MKLSCRDEDLVIDLAFILGVMKEKRVIVVDSRITTMTLSSCYSLTINRFLSQSISVPDSAEYYVLELKNYTLHMILLYMVARKLINMGGPHGR